MTETTAPANTHKNVFAAISAVMADLAVEGIGKDRKNEQQGYKFRGIDDVFNALSPILSKHQLCFLPRILSREVTERVTAKGGVLFYVIVEAEFDLIYAGDGSKFTVRTYGEAMDSGDKATNKAMSAAYKYAAMQTFAIPTEGDNDADATTHTIKPKAQSRETFDRLSKANRALKTIKEYDDFWANPKVKEAVATLPDDWKMQLEEEARDKAAEFGDGVDPFTTLDAQFPGDESIPAATRAAAKNLTSG